MHPERRFPSKLDAKYNFLFVVTYGRSGSTLLQGILNSFDGYCIRGENSNVLVQIFRIWRECHLIRKQFGSSQTSTKDSWFGAELIEPDALTEKMISAFKDHVLQPPEWARVIGYKEIRYTSDYFRRGELTEFFDFIDEWFPGSAFIFNTRKLSSVVQSGWWKYDADAMDILRVAERTMISTYNRFKHKSIWLRYDDYVKDAECLRALADFLGEPFDPERVRAVLSTTHSFITLDDKENDIALTGDPGIPAHGGADKYLVPSRDILASIGSNPEDFVASGDGFTREYLIRRANLSPADRVLDLYCGFGQKAQALARYLSENGRYEGLAASQTTADWCNSAYSQYSNFHFMLATQIPFGIANTEDGFVGDFRLPYADEEFDVVVCDELFFRLSPAQLVKCTGEISRILKKNGRCVATAFLLTSETTAITSSSNAVVAFPFERDGFRASSLTDLTRAVAIQEELVRNIFNNHGLRICEIVYGFWPNTPDLLKALHDCIIATK